MATKATKGVIGDSAIQANHLPSSLLTADATGRGKMADGFATRAKLGSDAINWATSMVVGCDCKNNASTPNTQFDLDADAVVLRKSDGDTVVRFNPGAAITNNIATAGSAANGRDQAGAFTDPSFVHFYWIWNGTTLATVSSASAPPTGPTLPSGYTHWAYAGAVYFSSAVLRKVRIKGSTVWHEAGVQVLTDGASQTEATVDCATAIPANALEMILFVSKTAVHNEKFRVIAGSDFTNTKASGNVGDCNYQLRLPNIGQQFFYILATANVVNVWAQGYKVNNGGE